MFADPTCLLAAVAMLVGLVLAVMGFSRRSIFMIAASIVMVATATGFAFTAVVLS